MEDREIIRRCQSGQEDLIDLLIDRHRTTLYSLCRKLTRLPAEADDLFQDTWLRAVRSIARFDLNRRFAPWLFAICINRHRDRLRKRRRWGALVRPFKSEHDLGRSAARDPAARMVAREQALAVRRALEDLDDAHRLPILLHYYREFTMTEIAEMLEIPAGTVKSRLNTARRVLRARLEELGHA